MNFSKWSKKSTLKLIDVWNNLVLFVCKNERMRFHFLIFPREFNKNCAKEDTDSFIGYIPWIEGHTANLIAMLGSEVQYKIKPISLFKITDIISRSAVNKFIRKNPEVYRVFLRHCFKKRKKVKAMIFTFDWLPTMRILVEECKKTDIATILIPHEGVFLNEDKYYWDEKTGVSYPACDYVLGWGSLQKRIFGKRGYPYQNYIPVGSPKLDECILYTPDCSKAEFCAHYQFDENKPILLFACQFLDVQIDTRLAQAKQNEILSDLMQYTEENDWQLIIRMPPNGIDVLNDENKKKAALNQNVVIDYSNYYRSSVKETIFYSSLVLSINSTMLFETVLMKKCALAVHYFDVVPPWGTKLIPAVHDKTELFNKLKKMHDFNAVYDANELKHVADLFGVGSFDGQSVKRIAEQIEHIVHDSAEK